MNKWIEITDNDKSKVTGHGAPNFTGNISDIIYHSVESKINTGSFWVIFKNEKNHIYDVKSTGQELALTLNDDLATHITSDTSFRMSYNSSSGVYFYNDNVIYGQRKNSTTLDTEGFNYHINAFIPVNSGFVINYYTADYENNLKTIVLEDYSSTVSSTQGKDVDYALYGELSYSSTFTLNSFNGGNDTDPSAINYLNFLFADVISQPLKVGVASYNSENSNYVITSVNNYKGETIINNPLVYSLVNNQVNQYLLVKENNLSPIRLYELNRKNNTITLDNSFNLNIEGESSVIQCSIWGYSSDFTSYADFDYELMLVTYNGKTHYFLNDLKDVFTRNITFKNGEEILESKRIFNVDYPSYTGATPTKESDAIYDYEFSGWLPSLDSEEAKTTTEFVAQFNSIIKQYKLSYYVENVLQEEHTVNANTVPLKPTIPEKEGFIGEWTPTIREDTRVLSDMRFDALYKRVGGNYVYLYQNSADEEVVDKELYLKSVGVITGFFKIETSILDVELTIEREKIDFNYVVLSNLNRCYYVRDITTVRTNLWKLKLEEDVLMTYRDQILDLKAFVGRNEFEFNPNISDKEVPVEFVKDIEDLEIGSLPLFPITNINVDKDGYENVDDSLLDGFGLYLQYLDKTETSYGYTIPSVIPNVIGDINSLATGDTPFQSVLQIKTDGLSLYQLSKAIIENENASKYCMSLVALPYDSSKYRDYDLVSSIDLGDTTVRFTNLGGSPNYQIKPRNNGSLMQLLLRIEVPRKYNNFMDYKPYTKYEIYLPYYKFVEIKQELFFDRYLEVYYSIPLNSSPSEINIYSRSKENSSDARLIDTYSFNLGANIPLNSDNYQQYLARVSSAYASAGWGVLASAISLIGGVSTGGISMVVGGSTALIGMGNAISTILDAESLSPNVSVKQGGGETNFYSPFRARIRVTRSVLSDGDNYTRYIGKPLNKLVKLSDLKGYTLVSKVHIENFNQASKIETDKIKQMLLSGVIL